MTLALIRIDPEEVVSTFAEGVGRIPLPGEYEAYVHSPTDGWASEGFRIAAVVPSAPPPKGKLVVGTSVLLVEGNPVEVLILDDAPAPAIHAMLVYAADKRWQVETAGIMVGDAFIDTSVESQNRINGAYVFAQRNPGVPISFKAVMGFTTLTSEQAMTIGQVVGTHVQTCFAIEAMVVADIEAGRITTYDEIDAAPWPKNHF